MVIGVNQRTAPESVLERYRIAEERRSEVLTRLAGAEGIEEVIVLANSNRTEFLLWASDPTLAANSVSRLLSAEYGLKLCEWEHFYRLLDDEALLHTFRFAAGLDSTAAEEPEAASQFKGACAHATKVGSTGRFLDAVVQKALAVAERVRSEAATPATAVEPAARGRRSSAAEKILAAEVQGFRSKLLAEQVPTIVALRHRLDQICRQELDSFREECGPFSKDQDEILQAVTSRLTQRIAGSLARELKESPEKVGQEQMTAAVQRLSHLKTPEPALAGAKIREELKRAWPEQGRKPSAKDFVADAESVKV